MTHGPIVVTGAGGVIGTILLPALAMNSEITAVDLCPAPTDLPRSVTWLQGSLNRAGFVRQALIGSSAVIHLATGAQQGWRGLRDVDISATKNLLDIAAQERVQRVILASSNHVVGGHELDAHAVGRPSPATLVSLSSPVRPDSAYGAAKVFAEAYGRAVAERGPTAVSCLRIGTVCANDSPEAAQAETKFSYLPGGRNGRLARLGATWLRHEDLIRIVREELDSSQRFRLRFAVSDSQARFWSLDVLTWNGESDYPLS